MAKIITGNDLGIRVAKALGLEKARRIILDMRTDKACLVYVEMFGDDRLYEIDFNGVNYEIKEGKESDDTKN